MRRPYQYITLILCILLSNISLAQGGRETAFSLVETSEGSYHMTFTLGDVMLSDIGNGTVGITADGMVSLASREGLPSLPQASRLLLLPRGATVQLTTWNAASEEVVPLPHNRTVAPYAGPLVKDSEPATPLPDADIYGGKALFRGGDPIEIEHLGTMGDRQVVRLTVHPVAYSPADATLLLTSTLNATLSVDDATLPGIADAQPERLLIVARSEFREGLQPFVRWKRQQGLTVTELYVDTHLRDSIKPQIATYFPRHQPERWPRYLLLVGDVAQIQAYLGTTHPSGLDNHITDLYYAEHTNDYLPDALVGRWPVGDTAALGAVVRKTLRYEQGLDLDTAQLMRLLLVAGNETQEPAPVTTNGQVRYVSREAKLAHPALDTLCYHNPASATQLGDILADLRQGVALLNYTAHCTTAGWSSPSVSFSTFDTLSLTQPLLWVNNCCHSNAFDGTCFGEQLLRQPVGGAIGVIGATNSTLWNEDYYWAVGPKYPFSLDPAFNLEHPGAFDRWLGSIGDVQTQGELLVAGNLAVTAFGSPYDRFYWEIYCLLGDPSLRPWVGVPQLIDLYTANGLPHNGDATLHLGGTPGVTVTAVQHDTVLGTGVIADNGLLALNLDRSLDTSSLILTATAAGHLPRFDTLQVLSVEGTGVALREVTITDSNVECRVENVGTTTLFGLRVVLSQMDADNTVGALVAEQQEVVDSLAPHQSRTLSLPLQLTIGQQPWWQAHLFAWDSTEGMLCCLTLQQMMEITYPTATFRLLEPDGAESHRLLPQHEYLLETTVDGSATTDLVVTALPSGDTLVTYSSPLSAHHLSITTPDSLTHLHIEATLNVGNHHTDYSYYLVASHRRDYFEEGFDSYPWRRDGLYPWTLDGATARSGAIGNRQATDLGITVLLHQADSISFEVMTSSEMRYDKFQFYVDNVRFGNELWGESGWRRYNVPLSAGRHSLKWRYVKDDTNSGGSDCAWLDNVRMPLALWDSAYGWFGNPELGIPTSVDACPLRVYPNPCSGTVAVEGVGQGTLRLLDLYGREIHTTTATPGTLDITPLPDGIYLLQVVTDKNRYYHKLIIRH